ncbi:MAG: DUF2213 domain-containing protein [Methanobrevibacter sp.]|nr:DUF2213 domain-containing protein [Methanobrevibacter sp.]
MKIENSTDVVFDDNVVEGKGRHFTSRFIEAGTVSYGDDGILKVTVEALNRFVQSFVGCPVIIRHQKVTEENADDIRCGVVSDVNFNPNDGWFWCGGVIWDKEAIKKIEQGWSVSCCYDATDTTGNGGEWHNQHYDDELIDGRFLHLAIVPNPRYEDATILLNSKEDKEMLLKLFNSKKVQENDKEEEVMTNEAGIDKNALKDKLLEHINKAVKGKGDIDGQSEDDWYAELNGMLDKLSYDDSEAEKSNSKKNEDEEEKPAEEDDKENECKNSDEEEKKEPEEEEKDNEDEEKPAEEEGKSEDEDVKENSKGDFEVAKRLHNSVEDGIKSDYRSESERIALGKALF